MKKLQVIYILPSRYDDDGHVLRFWRGVLPSNTLACLKSLTQDLADRQALGEEVSISVEAYDDTIQRVPFKRICRRAKDPDTAVVVGMVGVQSNQYPRALDLSLKFREHGIQVMIGGFHVSGVLALNEQPTPELDKALQAGVSLVRGEAEGPGVLEGILMDALHERMQPIYNITETPDIHDAPVPQPDNKYLSRFVGRHMSTIDTSRGCPFNCSFCTIINVQGRQMRHRSAQCILDCIRENYERGVTFYFFTDDNLARSPVWEEIFDGLIAMREAGKMVSFMMQVDTQAYKIPGFVEKASRAGCYQAFIGLETVNPDNVKATGKGQNKVDQFAKMVQTWRDARILVHVGYIIGLPHDTVDSVRRDIATLKDEIKVDQASFFMLTPLPGSRDHSNMVKNKTPLDADHNNYDSFHETFRHPNIPPGQWYELYREAWHTFYNKENITNILLRTSQERYWRMLWLLLWNRYSTLAGTHPMVTGFARLKERKARRSPYPRESVLQYAWRRVKDVGWAVKTYTQLFLEFQEVWLLSRKPCEPQWAFLAQMREMWATCRRRVNEVEMPERVQDAAVEVRSVLASASDRLHRLSQGEGRLDQRARAALKQKAQEVDQYVRSLEIETPNWQDVKDAERFLRDGLIARYEELTIRYVAGRRRFNAFWRRQWINLKSGRLWRLDFLQMPEALLFELNVGLRFGLGVARLR